MLKSRLIKPCPESIDQLTVGEHIQALGEFSIEYNSPWCHTFCQKLSGSINSSVS